MVASVFATNQPAFRGGGVAPTYDTASLAYFAAMSVQPNTTRKGLLDALIVGLKTDGVWTTGDFLALPAAHDAQAGLINAIAPALLMTVNGTMTFTADRGYQGDGTTGYLSTVTNANAWINFQQNTAALAVWVNDTAGSVLNIVGQTSSSVTQIAPYTGANLSVRPNGGTSINAAVANGLGLSAFTRTDASNVATYRNGASVATSAANTSAALSAEPILINKRAASFHPGRAAAIFIGSAITPTQQTALYNRLSTYLTAIGGN